MKVQAGGGFVEDVEGAAGVALGQLAGQLDPLRFTAGEGGGALPQGDIGQTDIRQRLQFAFQYRHGTEKRQRVLHRHFQHLEDVAVFVFHLQGFAVVAMAFADIAAHVNVGKEVHFHFDDAVPLARFAAAAFDVETEPSRAVTAGAGFRRGGEQVADRGEQAGVGGGVGARRAADGALIDIHHFVEMR